MIISTWNIRHGGGERVNDILGVLKNNSKSDVYVITEFRNNSNGSEILYFLKQLGYKYIKTIETEQRINSILIASKIKYESELFAELEEHKQRVIKIKTSELSIYGCYFPQKNLKKDVFEFLLKEIKTNKEENIIITGDFNTGKHFIDEKAGSFYCSEYLDKLENSGMVDAWRLINGQKKEYSWYSNAGNGFRIDHFFVSDSITGNIVSCSYSHLFREKKISDHSMMTLELKNLKKFQSKIMK